MFSYNKKGLAKLLSINALTCGLEIVSSCAYTYIPPMLLKAGYTETAMTIILGIAPLFDLLTVPLLADWSDSCTSSLGRRRPFIIFLASIFMFAIFLISGGPQILSFLTDTSSSTLHMLLLAVGAILLDYSYQALFNPCEALLSDLMTKENTANQTFGFTIHSACISLGCILGYLIVSIDWPSIIHRQASQAQISFFVTSLLFVPCLLSTLSNKEAPLVITHTGTTEKLKNIYISPVKQSPVSCLPNSHSMTRKSELKDSPDVGYESASSDLEESLLHGHSSTPFYRSMKSRRTSSCCYSTKLYFQLIKRTFWKFSSILMALPLTILNLVLGCFVRIKQASVVIQRLFLVELFGWTALVSHNFFFSNFVGQYIYMGNPNAAENSTEAILYDTGVRMGSIGLLLHSVVACVYAFFLQERLIRRLGPRPVFIGGLAIFSLGMILTVFSSTILFLHVVTAIAGIGFAALTTTPYMLVTMYCKNRKVYMPVNQTDRGLGAEVAVLDMAYYISQMLMSFSVGPMVDYVGSALPTMIVAAVASCLATYFAFKVVFMESHMELLLQGKF